MDTDIINKDCDGFHSNVAIAGIDKYEQKEKQNAGHSEHYLLSLSLAKMLSSYIINHPQNKCPSAAFLYTNNSPCFTTFERDGCVKDITNMKQGLIDTKCMGMPIYVGYTDIYRGDKNKRETGKIMLQMQNIHVLNIPKPYSSY